MVEAQLWEALSFARELWVQGDAPIPRVPAASLTVDSFRDIVARNRPVIITGALHDWPAYTRWQDLDYLRRRYGGARVTYNVTPTGWGDACIPVAAAAAGEAAHWFVKPEERQGTLADALTAVLDAAAPQRQEIAYVSFQNDNLRQEVPDMMAELGAPAGPRGSPRRLFHFSPWHAPGAGDATGADAINLWIGTRHSVSSTHKDHFENLYAVLRGRKYFTLCPPCDVLWLGVQQLPSGRFRRLRPPPAVQPCEVAAATSSGRRLEACPRCGGRGLLRRLAAGDGAGAGDGTLPHPPPPCASWCCDAFPVLGPEQEHTPASLPPAFSWGVVPELEEPNDDGGGAAAARRQVTVPWVTVDPARVPARLDAHDRAMSARDPTRRPTVFHVEVGPGEVLYLPSLWYHRVGQEGGGTGDAGPDGEVTVSVNAWFDMEYTGPAYAYYRMCQALAEAGRA